MTYRFVPLLTLGTLLIGLVGCGDKAAPVAPAGATKEVNVGKKAGGKLSVPDGVEPAN